MNGFIYPIFDKLIGVLYYTNIVELFKYIAKCIPKHQNKTDKEDFISYANIGIDIYQIFKWSMLIIFWFFEYKNQASKFIIYYLIYSNLFVYFYYHVWGSKYKQRTDRKTLNRKFLNYLSAIAFYLLCYAYLYQMHFSEIIKWPDNLIDSTNAIYLSIANAFTLTYGGFMPLTQEARVVFMSELINTFLFFTIIVSNSIPNHTEGIKEDELQK